MTLLKDGGMSAPAWAFFTTIVTMIGYNIRAAIQGRSKADEAIRLSQPTGNGFTKELWKRLDRIESRLTTVEDKIDESKTFPRS